jgi:hypothetical protein
MQILAIYHNGKRRKYKFKNVHMSKNFHMSYGEMLFNIHALINGNNHKYQLGTRGKPRDDGKNKILISKNAKKPRIKFKKKKIKIFKKIDLIETNKHNENIYITNMKSITHLQVNASIQSYQRADSNNRLSKRSVTLKQKLHSLKYV